MNKKFENMKSKLQGLVKKLAPKSNTSKNQRQVTKKETSFREIL